MNRSMLAASLLLALAVPAIAQDSAQPKATVPVNPAAEGAAETPAAPPSAFPDEKDRTSYAIGLNLGKAMRSQNVDVNPELVVEGLRAGLAGGDTKMGDEELKATLQEFQQKMMTRQKAEFEEKAKAAAAKSQKFLQENKAKEGVVTLPSGLQYQVLEEGTGATPTRRGHRHRPVRGQDGRRQGVRQLLRARQAGDLPGQRRHPGLDRGAAAHEGGRQVPPVRPARAGLRRARRRRRHRPQRGADLRRRAALDRRQERKPSRSREDEVARGPP